MICVLDASAAVEIALEREKSPDFRKLVQMADLVTAPDLYSSEITNVFWKYVKLSNMPHEQGEKGIAFCVDLIDDFLETRLLCAEVFTEAVKTGHPAYDLFYVIAARRQGATLLTQDRKLRQLAKSLGVGVVG